MTAARIIFDRIAPIRRGRPIRFDLPLGTDAAGIAAAFDAVLRATADGELTPEEGASVAAVLARFSHTGLVGGPVLGRWTERRVLRRFLRGSGVSAGAWKPPHRRPVEEGR